MTPSVAELVDFLLKIEDDPERRTILNLAPFEIFKAAVDDGIFEHLEQDAFARLVGKAVQQNLIGFERTHAAVPPPGPVWSDSDFQMRSGYLVTIEGRQLVDLFRRQRDHGIPTPAPEKEATQDPTRVMVVHGREKTARDDLFEFLIALGLKPIGWIEAVKATGKGSPFNAEAVEAAFRLAQAAVVLFTPDEQVRLRADLRSDDDSSEEKWAWQARPNVFYEGGIAFTSHPDRTIMLEHGRTRVPSDLEGRNTVRTSAGPVWRHEFVERLRSAGCPVVTEGNWLTAGTFESPKLDDTENQAMPVSFANPKPIADLPDDW